MFDVRPNKLGWLWALSLTLMFGLDACASDRHIEPYRDVSCFNRAAVSLSEAVTFAQDAREGLIIDAEYNCREELGCLRGNPGGYDITYYQDGSLERVNVCPVTGTVRPPLEQGMFQRLLGLDFLYDWPESEMLRGAPVLASAPVSMLAAIERAENARGLNAMAAHARTEGGQTYYAIEIVDNGRIELVFVDPESGNLLE